MATIVHSAMTDADGIHEPKGFDAASNESYLIKNSSGNLEWSTDTPLIADQAGAFGYLAVPYDTVFTGAGWTEAVGDFTIPVAQGFTTVGNSYGGIVYNHPETHWMIVNVTATLSTSVTTTTVHLGYDKNANLEGEPGTSNGVLLKTSGEAYNLSTTFAIEMDTGDEFVLMMQSDKAATITMVHAQVTVCKMFQDN